MLVYLEVAMTGVVKRVGVQEAAFRAIYRLSY